MHLPQIIKKIKLISQQILFSHKNNSKLNVETNVLKDI